MINENNFIFSEDSIDETKEAFYNFLGQDSQWFGTLLYLIKEEWIDRGGIVTDILIRENKPIYVAAIKSYVPFFAQSQLFDDEQKQLPTERDITSVLISFTDDKGDFKEEGTTDFSFFVMGLGIFRVNISKDNVGIGMSIRYLNYNIPTFEKIGYPAFYSNYIKNIIVDTKVKTPDHTINIASVDTGGLILHTGATGSGKTTSLAAEVGYIAENTTGIIITYENPIEYRYIVTKAPVRQYELEKDICSKEGGHVFDNVKRHLLRNNPSTVLIGEARDNYEIKSMLDFSARGHLVFGTIHASNIKEALTTLMAVSKEEPYLVANTLKAIVAHKLISTQNGQIIPLFEIFIPNQVCRSRLSKGDIDYVNKMFYIEKQMEHCITFEQSLEKIVRKGSITPQEANNIKTSNIGLFRVDQ